MVHRGTATEKCMLLKVNQLAVVVSSSAVAAAARWIGAVQERMMTILKKFLPKQSKRRKMEAHQNIVKMWIERPSERTSETSCT